MEWFVFIIVELYEFHSMQSLSNFQKHFPPTGIEQKIETIYMESQKTLSSESNPGEKRTNLEVLHSLISNYITKLIYIEMA